MLLHALLLVSGPLFQPVPPIFPHFPPFSPIFLVFPFFSGCITGCITSPPGRVILLPGIPCGPGSFLKKVIFLHPVDLVDPFWHPPLWVTSCSLPQPTRPRYRGLSVG